MRTAWSLDGNRQKLDGGSLYGNAPRTLWERWSPTDAAHRISLACRCLLIEEGGRRILLEAGIGAFFSPELRDRYGVEEERHVLLDSLAALGLGDGDIDLVVLSHLHFDHAGGLLSRFEDGPPTLLFPNARFLVGAAAWDRACTPHVRDRASFVPTLNEQLAASGRLVLVEGPTHPLLPGWRFHLSDGHTPGMLLTEIPGNDGPVVFTADLVPARPWVHTAITMGYDRFPERVVEEKTALLEDLLARGGRVFFTHDPDWAIGTVRRDAKGRFGTTDERAALVASPL